MINDEDIKSKLLILFILEKLEMPINEDILLQMCSLDNNWIPYFCFSQLIQELATARFITRQLDENNQKDHVLTISEDGKICLSHFFKDIYQSVRNDVTTYIRNNKLNYRKKQEFACNYVKNNDGSYTINCAILDGQTPIFEFKFVVPTMAKAVSVSNAWQNKAVDVYKIYLDMIID